MSRLTRIIAIVGLLVSTAATAGAAFALFLLLRTTPEGSGNLQQRIELLEETVVRNYELRGVETDLGRLRESVSGAEARADRAVSASVAARHQAEAADRLARHAAMEVEED
jgi:hypothetical protein